MNRLTHARIERAIRRAEAGTTGRIAVRIVPEPGVDAFARAKDEFTRAGLHATKLRNATLILVASASKQYAVLGDRDIHNHVRDAFWTRIVADMRPFFAKGDSAAAIEYAVEAIGRELHKHFPASQGEGSS